MKDNTQIFIWTGVIAFVFFVLWFTGNLVKLRNYVLETREELRKCTWPTLEELRGSTVLVVVSIVLLGVFTVVVDFALTNIVKKMMEF
jgi:preprotein translocase subunit SecE